MSQTPQKLAIFSTARKKTDSWPFMDNSLYAFHFSTWKPTILGIVVSSVWPFTIFTVRQKKGRNYLTRSENNIVNKWKIREPWRAGRTQCIPFIYSIFFKIHRHEFRCSKHLYVNIVAELINAMLYSVRTGFSRRNIQRKNTLKITQPTTKLTKETSILVHK